MNDLAIRPSGARHLVLGHFGDDRGWFSETFKEKDYGASLARDNHPLSRIVGTLCP
jgi:dTDP-4-dehydrorhamnose 3,5-epimerase-like enzyme